MEKTIDIDKILAGKMGAKSKYVPGFVVKWLKRIIHEDEVNRFLWESRDKVGTEWLTECVRYLDMTLQLEGVECRVQARCRSDFLQRTKFRTVLQNSSFQRQVHQESEHRNAVSRR